MIGEVTPFQISAPQPAIDDLRARLARTRWTDSIGAPWEYGVDANYLRELCAYWMSDFDWRGYEGRFNAQPSFLTTYEGQRIHFYHVRSPEPNARALILTHGWPGSVAEFHECMTPLANPAAHGGDARDAFHVVAPALPGFGYSGPTHETGWGGRRIARAFHALMQRLGYEEYFVQGGDKGSLISILLAADYPQHVKALHLNLLAAPPLDPADLTKGVAPHERDYVSANAAFAATGSGYQLVHRTRPQTLAFALMDSPAGLAAWMLDKFQAWSDCGGDVERSFSRDRLLDTISLYWLTGTIGSSMRIYFEDHGPGRDLPLPRVDTPTGHALFPAEIIKTPRAWAERRFNIQHWRVMPRGGHFAAMEEPTLFVDELRAFFRAYR